MGKTLKKALSWATEKLERGRIPTSNLDAEVLLAHVLQKPREYILAHPKKRITESQMASYELLITRRSRSEPIAYLTGHKEFYGLDFIVDKNTLIPRPETELMVDEALGLLRSTCSSKLQRSGKLRNNIAVIDVGTGSGNIIISVAKQILDSDLLIENIELFAIEPSKNALGIASQNAEMHNVEEKITFLPGRFLNPVLDSTFDIRHSKILILANLPYLSEKIYKSSPSSVKNFEPKKALLSGKDGLDHYRKLLNQLRLLVESYKLRVTVLFEISPEQKNLIEKEIAMRFPDSKMDFEKDLAGKWRMIKTTV